MQKKIRGNAFDITSRSAVVVALNPRQRAYKAGPGIHVVGSAQGRRDAELRRAMRMTRLSGRCLHAVFCRQKKSPVEKTGTLVLFNRGFRT